MPGIKVVDLTGSPGDRGYKHGQILQDRIHGLYDQFITMMETVPQGQDAKTVRFPERALLAFAQAHNATTKDYAPDIHQELVGIAGGAKIPFERVLLLNCVAEIRRLKFGDTAIWKSEQTNPTEHLVPPQATQPGCTCFAAQGRATVDGQVYIGQGYDIEPIWEPIVFRISDERQETEQVVMGHPGILAQFGMNAAGLAFVTSGTLVSDQRPGVPAPVVARKILQQKRLSDGLEAVVRARRTIGADYVLASPFGVANLETSAAAYDCHYLQDEVFACANHVRSTALKHLQAGLYGMDSFVRHGRMLQLLEAGRGALDMEALKEIQGDHADYPFGICRHTVEGLSDAQTRCAVIVKPSECLMLIADGNPCSTPYEEFRIGVTT
jgi:isopenicillin-N N-acyltransferase-like protein